MPRCLPLVFACALLAACQAPLRPTALVTQPAAAVRAEAGLLGKVKAPATLLGKAKLAADAAGVLAGGGGQLVSNNGAGIVANHAGRYAVAALAQEPFAGVRVRLLDATGGPVRVEGRPLETTTDAAGTYVFQGIPAGVPLIVQVDLPGGLGELRALAVPDGPREVDVEVVSTLTSGYILERYVRPQQDPNAALRRLTAAVEAETRARAAAALAAARLTPESTERERVLGWVETLRSRDAGLDAQLEAVKRLLIPAGQLDLGNGREASRVALKPRGPMRVEADGSLIFTDVPAFARLWRLTPAGRLEALVGANRFATDLGGKPALEAGLVPGVTSLARDVRGRLVIADYGGMRLSRLGEDGRVEALWDVVAQPPATGAPRLALAVWPGSGPEDLWVAFAPEGEATPAIWRVTGGRPVEPVAPLSLGEVRVVEHGTTPAGELLLAFDDVLRRFDPSTRDVTPVWDAGAAGFSRLTLDARGVALAVGREGGLWARHPDGRLERLLAQVPDDAKLGFGQVAHGAGSTWLVRDEALVVRVREGALEAVAGSLDPGSNLGDLSFTWPESVAPLPEGGLIVADSGADRLVEVQPSGAVWPRASLPAPRRVRLAPDGTLWVLGARGLLREGPKGLEPVEATGLPAGARCVSFALSPAGAPWAVFEGPAGLEIFAQTAEGGWRKEGTVEGDAVLGLAAGPDNTLYAIVRQVFGPSRLQSRAPGTLTWRPWATGSNVTSPLVDALGRVYLVERDEATARLRLVRHDGPDGPRTVIAGPDGRVYRGDTVDTGLSIDVSDLAFDTQGGLLLVDTQAKQIKRIAPDALR